MNYSYLKKEQEIIYKETKKLIKIFLYIENSVYLCHVHIFVFIETCKNIRINFYLLRTFTPHLGSFCVVSFFTTFRPNFTSGLLQVIYRDLG